ncbi:MAG TPA: sensor domain-containing diguanylate cyclase [Candidatus Acidoferrales bacterium]|nr:sensor domain-containing diguanylate cyclase [Candidatus Acidoferrales bacterium]
MFPMPSPEPVDLASSPPERFVVEVFSELRPETIQKRWEHVNVILRMSMLTGLQMQLEATLNLLCDMTADMAPFDKAMVYFWDEGGEMMELRIARNVEKQTGAEIATGNILNFWSIKYGRPLLVEQGHNAQSDALMQVVGATSAMVVPLFVSNRVMGSLQLFRAGTAKPFTKEDAQLLWILSLVAENLLTREYANEGLLRFAFTDYLTGLRTRGYFEQQLELEFKRAERKQQKFALLMIDIDHFKVLNDTFGHHVGDQLLRDVTSILMKDMREVDTVARYGGEEFVIILPETSETGAVFVAQRLRRAVEQAKFFAGSPHSVQHLTISIGVALYDTDAQFKRDLIEFADAALYAAKHAGRNRVMCYSELSKQGREVS